MGTDRASTIAEALSVATRASADWWRMMLARPGGVCPLTLDASGASVSVRPSILSGRTCVVRVAFDVCAAEALEAAETRGLCPPCRGDRRWSGRRGEAASAAPRDAADLVSWLAVGRDEIARAEAVADELWGCRDPVWWPADRKSFRRWVGREAWDAGHPRAVTVRDGASHSLAFASMRGRTSVR